MDRPRNPLLYNSPPTHFHHNYQQPHPRQQQAQFFSFSPDFRPEHKPQSSHPYHQQEAPRRPPPPQFTQQTQESSNRQKFKDMTDDLAKLKQQLQSIMNNSSAQKLRSGSNYIGNKSSDNLFAPHARVDQYKVPKVSLQQNGPENIKNVSKTHERINLKSEPPVEKEKTYLSKEEVVFPQKLPTNAPLFQQEKKNHFGSSNPTSTQDRKVAIIENPNRKQAAKRESLTKQRKEENKIEKSENLTVLENSQRRNFRYEIEKIKVEMQSQIDKLALENTNLLQKNQNLLSDLEKAKSKVSELEEKKKTMEEQNQLLKSRERTLEQKIKKMEENLNECKSEKKSENRDSFDHVLIDQLQETAKFRQMLDEKNEEIMRLNEIILLNRRKAEEAINEVQIQKLKHISEMKQQEQTFDIKSLSLENQIKSAKHAMETLTAKLQVAVRENKSKDDFLQQHLVGRLKSGEEQEYVKNFLKKYEIEFPINNILSKLLEEERIIRELRERLGEKAK